MDLEQRVQALEQEVEVLKNQIQATLLDIQAQILTNAHPTLRSSDSAAATTPHNLDNGPTSPMKVFKPQGEANDAEPHPNRNSAELPNVRKIKLDDAPVTPPAEPAPMYEARPVAAQARPDNNSNWSTVDEMEDWVSNKVDKIGSERTRSLIYMYEESGRFTADMVDTMLRLVDLYDGGISRPFEFDDPTEPSPPLDWLAQDLVEPTEMPLPLQSTRRPGSSEHSEANVRQAAAQPEPDRAHKAPRQAPADAQAFDALPQSKSQARHRAPAAHSTEHPPAVVPDEGSVPEERRTILRLIAGLYNAGAGMKRGK